jgi:hypothetical protein
MDRQTPSLMVFRTDEFGLEAHIFLDLRWPQRIKKHLKFTYRAGVREEVRRGGQTGLHVFFQRDLR